MPSLVSTFAIVWLSAALSAPPQSSMSIDETAPSGEVTMTAGSDIGLTPVGPCTPVIRSPAPLPCPPWGLTLLGCGAAQAPALGPSSAEAALNNSRGGILSDPGLPVNLLATEIFRPPRPRPASQT